MGLSEVMKVKKSLLDMDRAARKGMTGKSVRHD